MGSKEGAVVYWKNKVGNLKLLARDVFELQRQRAHQGVMRLAGEVAGAVGRVERVEVEMERRVGRQEWEGWMGKMRVELEMVKEKMSSGAVGEVVRDGDDATEMRVRLDSLTGQLSNL